MSVETFARMDSELEDMARKVGDFRPGTPGYGCKSLVRTALSIVDRELDALRGPSEIPTPAPLSKFQKAAALVREALAPAENVYNETTTALGADSGGFVPWERASYQFPVNRITKALEALENEA